MKYKQERRKADETRNGGPERKKSWRREKKMIQNSMWESNKRRPYIRQVYLRRADKQ